MLIKLVFILNAIVLGVQCLDSEAKTNMKLVVRNVLDNIPISRI
jgi:hypothetical protein